MSPRFEAFVARLYVDQALRRRFLDNAKAEATRAGLTPSEIEAVERMDRVGLELAADSFEHKRRLRTRTRHPIAMRWRQLFRRS